MPLKLWEYIFVGLCGSLDEGRWVHNPEGRLFQNFSKELLGGSITTPRQSASNDGFLLVLLF